MDLVLFDIDGTLIRSMRDDGDCLVEALQTAFGFADVDDDWSRYRYITDAGVMIEAFEERRGRTPSTAEIENFRRQFVASLARRCAQRRLQQVPGAAALLAELAQRDDIAVAFATGCFRQTAVLKMESAGLCFDQVPSATCNDAISREDIMQIAINRAATQHGLERFENLVYVGDGIWDVWACRRLGVPFIGITADIAADRLRAEGVEYLLSDFRDRALFDIYRKQASRGAI